METPHFPLSLLSADMAMAISNPNRVPASSSLITRETAAEAVEALLQWIAAQTKHKKAQLLDHDTLIHVVVTMKKIPAKARTNPYLIPLPHSLHDINESAICLFVDDRTNAPVSPEMIREQIVKESIEVIALADLKADYVPYEARRKLCGSYELFFADKRIVPLLPRLIGKHFFKKKKHPLPVDVSRKSWKEQVKKGCGSALLYVSTGTSSQINVGRLSMGKDMIVDNVVKAIEGAIQLIPKRWANVRSILVKSEESIGLPVYQALPDVKFRIDVGKRVDGENSEGEVVHSGEEDELGSEKKKKVKEIGSKKGKIHKIRYMDANADTEGLLADDDSDHLGSLNDGSDNDEIVVEAKKKKKDAKKMKKAEDVKVVEKAKEQKGKKVEKLKENEKLDGAKKRKAKSNKSESKEDQGKKSQKSKKSKVQH